MVITIGVMTIGVIVAAISEQIVTVNMAMTSTVTATRTVMKNKQVGDDGQPRWECKAELPYGVTFGEVLVSCEGYESRDDPFVLIGSCSLTYSLDSTGIG